PATTPTYVADANPVRNYSATVSPTTDTAGHVLSSYTLTVKNETSSDQDLGSVNVTVPTGYTTVVLGSVTASSGKTWTAALSLSVIQLRSNSNPNRLAPGESVSVALTVTAPCTAGSYTWTTAARQSTDFSGSTNFTLVGSDPTVTITG